MGLDALHQGIAGVDVDPGIAIGKGGLRGIGSGHGEGQGLKKTMIF